MKHISIIIALFLVVGCSIDNSDMTQKDYSEVKQDSNGLILKPSVGMYVTFEEVVSLYNQTQMCMGMTAYPPTVWFRDFKNEVGIGDGWGVYSAAGKLVLINNNMPYPFERNIDTDRQTLKHEYVHHILRENNLAASSRGHSSPMFQLCGNGVNVSN